MTIPSVKNPRWLAAAILLCLTLTPPCGGEPRCLSPLALAASRDGKTLFVAESAANRVDVIGAASGKIERTIVLPDAPGGLALSADGSRLFVSGAVPVGRVHVVNLAKRRIEASIGVGHTPGALAAGADGRTLYACNRFSNDVSVIDLAARKEAARIPVLREPAAAALTPDGKLLMVANMLPTGPGNINEVAGAVSLIDTAQRKTAATIRLPNGSTSLRGACISPDGKFGYVTHILARYLMPTTQIERGWMNTNALSVLDLERRQFVDTVLLDDIDQGAANPCAVACTADGKSLLVTHAGSQELSVIDREGMHARLARAAAGQPPSEASMESIPPRDNLSFLVGLRQRVSLTGNGPRSVALAGSRVYVANYFTDSLDVVDLGSPGPLKAQPLSLGRATPMTLIRKGEMIFNDASYCFQKWQSCASCHPGEARADGLNWDLLNDGLGNPKNTKSMLLAHRTPPAMGLGVRDTAETAVRSGIKFIEFAVRPEEDAAAVDAYLKSLKPMPSPRLVKSRLSESARRGRTIFAQAGCAACHQPPLYTDKRQYDLKTGAGMDQDKAFDTPTLIEAWRTAPYLHDGRAATIRELLTTYNKGDTHGKTSDLNESEINDLAEFVLSL